MDKIVTKHGTFTSNVYLGLSAEEVYQEWLESKDKPSMPTYEELQTEFNVDLDFRLSMIEMGL